jgi:hypothetical protein
VSRGRLAPEQERQAHYPNTMHKREERNELTEQLWSNIKEVLIGILEEKGIITTRRQMQEEEGRSTEWIESRLGTLPTPL